jgi:hypothetical protein
MPNRMIQSAARTSSMQLEEVLASLFALELLFPSEKLFIFSPWISDIELLNNQRGQFRVLFPDSDGIKIRLSQMLNRLADVGQNIYIVTRPDHRWTEEFLLKLNSKIKVRKVETLHEKGIISQHFYLRGSMNLTYSGINLNDEHVEISSESSTIAAARIRAWQRWEGLSE